MISEADGYQPHLIAPEQGYRRLIDGALNYFRGPADASVDAVSAFFFLFMKYGVPFYFLEGWGGVVLGEVIEISNHLYVRRLLCYFPPIFGRLKMVGPDRK